MKELEKVNKDVQLEYIEIVITDCKSPLLAYSIMI